MKAKRLGQYAVIRPMDVSIQGFEVEKHVNAMAYDSVIPVIQEAVEDAMKKSHPEHDLLHVKQWEEGGSILVKMYFCKKGSYFKIGEKKKSV